VLGRRDYTQEEIDNAQAAVHRALAGFRGLAAPGGFENLADSLMNNGGVLRTNNVIKWVPEDTVLKLRAGDTIALTADDFERLADAFFEELKRKFL
jgi:hypothetical protein